VEKTEHFPDFENTRAFTTLVHPSCCR